jgi:hypothetical protein
MRNVVLFMALFIASASVKGQGWSEFGVGLAGLNANGQIGTVITNNTGKVYVSGAFVLSGARNIYTWGTSHWEPVGSMNPYLWYATMCTDAANNVYTAGAFENMSGRKYVAKWNGANWSELGIGGGALNANDIIWSVCANAAGNVFAAGDFTNGAGYNYVARWGGSSWGELGAGTGALNANGTIYTICADITGNVYAGGYFTDATGQYYVAKWNPVSNVWAMMGSNFNGAIQSICVGLDGSIYAGGSFTNAEGYAYVARWDGTQWVELGTGTGKLNKPGYVLTISAGKNGSVFAAGTISTPTGKRLVAHWDGTAWSELGAANPLNANSNIFTVCADTINNYVYAAGNFTNVYDKYYVAKCAMPTATTAVGAVVGGSINVFPNPAGNRVFIECSGMNDAQRIYITDVSGRVLLEEAVKSNKHTVDISKLTTGLYLVRVQAGDRIYVSKLAKE